MRIVLPVSKVTGYNGNTPRKVDCRCRSGLAYGGSMRPQDESCMNARSTVPPGATRAGNGPPARGRLIFVNPRQNALTLWKSVFALYYAIKRSLHKITIYRKFMQQTHYSARHIP
jgi:hypothetical protein